MFQTHFRRSPGSTMALLAPICVDIHADFPTTMVNKRLHEALLYQLQTLRSQVYIQDRAITERQLTCDGRHALEIDHHSWHILTITDGRVTGCVRYTEYPPRTPFEQLNVRHCALAHSDVWRLKLIDAIRAEARQAEDQNRAYVEVGGWALAEERRSTTDALRLALGGFALGQLLGGCLGVTTATIRNNSSGILRRLGGRSFEYAGVELPRYYDPQYGCEMDLLRFDSDRVNPKFASVLSDLKAELTYAPVIAATKLATAYWFSEQADVRSLAV